MTSLKSSHNIIALDVGERRIGVARADSQTKLPFPVGTVLVDEGTMEQFHQLIADVNPAEIVVGYPRNQQGEATAQTATVQAFARQLEIFGLPIIYQDESLTSVLAEQHLKRLKKSYTKEDIDAYAAVIILSDYLEAHYR